MAMDFPDTPTTGDSFTVGNRTWIYDGTAWELVTTSLNLPSAEDSIPLILALS
jgi:hypothetical protein